MNKEILNSVENKEILNSVETGKKILRVGVDLDNTLFDLSGPLLAYINKKFGVSFSVDDINTYWYFRTMLKELKVSDDEIEFHINELLRRSDDKHRVYQDSPPFPGAVETLNGIYRMNLEVFALTSRPPGLGEVVRKQFEAVGIDWVKGDWADGGNILIRDEEYWEKIPGDEFKLRAIRGDFPYGKYQDFPGLDYHLDDDGSLMDHDLAKGCEDRLFFATWGFNHRLISSVPVEKRMASWWQFYKLVRCQVRGERFNPADVI